MITSSPIFFVIGMEALNRPFKRVVEGNYMSSCKAVDRRGEKLVISHLLYANDTLLFCEADKDQYKFLSRTLIWFEAMSGLRINLNKGDIIPVGPIANVEELATELGCGVSSLPTFYLAFPLEPLLGTSHKVIGVWYLI